MSPRAAIGWAMWVAGLAAIAVSAYLSTKNPPISTTQTPESAVEGALWLSAWIGFGLVGALLVTSRPRNRIGWILCGITFTLGLALFAAAYARYALVTRAGTLPVGAVAAWLATWTFVPLVFLVIALVALFPSGSTHSGAARWILRIGALVALLTALAFAFRPGPIQGDTPPSNPLGISGTKPFLDNAIQILGTALGAVALAALIDGIVRFRRSSGIERQQFRWFILAVAAFPVLFFGSLVIEELVGYETFDPVVIAFMLWGNGTAIAIGLAVTRHGLYDIDRVISRTVSYGLLTASLAVVYVALVFVLRELLPFQGQVPVAASTLVIAALFGPLRRRLQEWVDRRFNRSRFDAARTIESFSSRLTTHLDLDDLSRDLRSTAVEVMQPASATLWLR